MMNKADHYAVLLSETEKLNDMANERIISGRPLCDDELLAQKRLVESLIAEASTSQSTAIFPDSEHLEP